MLDFFEVKVPQSNRHLRTALDLVGKGVRYFERKNRGKTLRFLSARAEGDFIVFSYDILKRKSLPESIGNDTPMSDYGNEVFVDSAA